MKNRDYLKGRLIDPTGELTIWGHSITKAYSAVARLAFVPTLGFYRRSDWLVLGSRIFNQLSPTLKSKSHLAMSARDLFRCNSFPHSLSYDLKTYADINALFETADDSRFVLCRSRVEKVISRTCAKFLVVNSTIDPINRLWLQVAKSAGLKTICVQHGVYSNNIPSFVLEEDIVDEYISLDQGQSDIVSKNIPRHKIKILGLKAAFDWVPPDRPLRVCFVGEDWERYGYDDLKISIISTYKKIILSSYSKTWGALFYKPHPSEQMFLDIMEYTSLLRVNDIDLPDVYIGFASTFLKEMGSRHKLVIQIFDVRTQSENFQQLGYCLSLPNDALLPEAISGLLNSPQQVRFIKNAELSQILCNYD